jgi:hypothetical protein
MDAQSPVRKRHQRSSVGVRTLAVFLLTIVALAASAPAVFASRSGKKAIWGLTTTPDGHSAFPIYHDLGVGIFQDDLFWRTVAPTRPRHPRDPNDPAYHWPAVLSYAIQQASQYHMRVMLLVFGSPGWANGGRPWYRSPRRAQAYADFLMAASRRFRSVHLWMVWGEPSRSHNFEPLTPAPPGARNLTAAQQTAPHRYAALLDAGYGALKQVSKRNLVIGGNTFTTGDISTRQWIDNLYLANGRRPRMDLYGHNPFSFRRPNLSNPPSPKDEFDFSDLGRLSQLVNRSLAPRHHNIKLFLSEWTIPTAPGDQEFNFWVDPGVASQWITDAWRIVRKSRFIYALGWVHVYDDPPGKGSTGGLLDFRGNPKPTYYAYKAG